MASNLTLLDGAYTRGFFAGRSKVTYPFRQNGDTDSVVIVREFRQSLRYYLPGKLGVDRDPVYSNAYLVNETDPVPTGLVDVVATTRTYARIPSTQTVPGSQYITKPDIPGTFPQVIGSYEVFKPNENAAAYDAYTINTVSAYSAAVSSFYPTGGTYTISFAGSTTGSLNYNDGPSTVETALNLLTPISNRGNVAVTGAYNSASGLGVAFANYSALTVDTSSLTVGTGITKSSAVTTSVGGYNQAVAIAATIDNGNPSSSSSVTPSNANPLGFLSLANVNDPNTINDFRILLYNLNNNVVATGGTYTLSVFGQTTGSLNYNATEATVAAALNGLSNVAARGSYAVTFVGSGTYSYSSGYREMWCRFTPNKITGGTYTLTVGGNTTSALAYNAGIAAIQTALNALTSVSNRGGCTVTGTGFTSGAIGFSVIFSNPALTVATGSLTPAGATATVALADGTIGKTQSIVFNSATASRSITVSGGHGISSGDTIYVKADGIYYSDIDNFSVTDSANLVISVSPSSALGTATAITEVGKRTITGYTPTAVLTRVKYITDFYLVGVSPGITTIDDIPLPTYEGDSTSLTAAIFSGDTSINYQVGELSYWRDTCILARTTTTLNATQL